MPVWQLVPFRVSSVNKRTATTLFVPWTGYRCPMSFVATMTPTIKILLFHPTKLGKFLIPISLDDSYGICFLSRLSPILKKNGSTVKEQAAKLNSNGQSPLPYESRIVHERAHYWDQRKEAKILSDSDVTEVFTSFPGSNRKLSNPIDSTKWVSSPFLCRLSIHVEPVIFTLFFMNQFFL